MTSLLPQTRRARHAAVSLLFSLIGLLLLVASAGYGMYQIGELRERIDVQKDELSELELQAGELQREVETIRDGSVQKLIEAGYIEAKSVAWETGETTFAVGRTRPLFNYVVWLDVPFARKADILEVKYEFPHPSFIHKEQSSREASNGFAVGYLGWGDLPSVPITIVPKDDGAENGKIDFPMKSRVKIIRDTDN